MNANAEKGGDELATLRSENARLISLLDAHGIEWQLPPDCWYALKIPQET